MDIEYISNHIKCTKEEKILCMETVKKLLRLLDVARREGILKLEETIFEKEYESPPLIQIGALLIIDGTDPEHVKSILENYIISSDLTNKEFLENILIYNAILAIQQGENPRCIEERLCSLFGLDFIEEFKICINRRELESELLESIEQMEEKWKDFEKTDVLDFIPNVMDRSSIQRIIRELSLTVIEYAMIGSKRVVIEYFLENLSKQNQIQFFEDMNYINVLDNKIVERNQKKILEVIETLNKSAEILLFSRTEMKILTQEEINELLSRKNYGILYERIE